MTCVAKPEVVNSAFTYTERAAHGRQQLGLFDHAAVLAHEAQLRPSVGAAFGLSSRTHVSNGGTVEPSARYHVLDVWRAPAAEWPSWPKYIDRST